jgi:hypothetical protein
MQEVEPDQDNPYHITDDVPTILSKTNFAPYHSALDDISEWPTDDRLNTSAPPANKDDLSEFSSSYLPTT